MIILLRALLLQAFEGSNFIDKLLLFVGFEQKRIVENFGLFLRFLGPFDGLRPLYDVLNTFELLLEIVQVFEFLVVMLDFLDISQVPFVVGFFVK